MDIFKEIKMTSIPGNILNLDLLQNSRMAQGIHRCPRTPMLTFIIIFEGVEFALKVVKSVDKFVLITDKLRRALTTNLKDQNVIEIASAILDCISIIELSRLFQSVKANKKLFNLYKKTCCSQFYKICTIIAAIIAITFESGEMSDHKSSYRSDITTIYGGLRPGPSIMQKPNGVSQFIIKELVVLTNHKEVCALINIIDAIHNRSDIKTTGSFDQPCIYTIADTLKSGDVVIPTCLDN